MLEAFLDWLARLPTLPTYVVLALCSALENVFPPVPADVAVALGAFLAQRGEVSAPLLGLVCWSANQASAAWVYFLARRQGEAFLKTRIARWLVPPAALGAIRDAYARHGAAGIFLSRFLPGVRAAVLPFAGLAGMSPARALVPCALASAIWYTLLIVAGAALGLSWPAVRALVDRASGLLALVGAAAALLAIFWIWRRGRRDEPSSE
jgi:membrane protein DedA with SNARE-associated domain